ncbi:hypothetical protein A4G19_08465 [Pasteurellaceae bacterium Macca]|nr:hypothetical protein [Pasteurellaceae bacterium Macca]
MTACTQQSKQPQHLNSDTRISLMLSTAKLELTTTESGAFRLVRVVRNNQGKPIRRVLILQSNVLDIAVKKFFEQHKLHLEQRHTLKAKGFI